MPTQLPNASIPTDSSLYQLLDWLRTSSISEREKGTYFEELSKKFFATEPTYRDLYEQVWSWGEWGPEHGFGGIDDGIDLVAKTRGTGEYHAIQCKFYDFDYRLAKKDIDSFFTASGRGFTADGERKTFTQRIIVSTTMYWTANAEAAMEDQNPPVTRIDLETLQNSIIDWTQYKRDEAPIVRSKKELRSHQVQALNAVSSGLTSADRGKLIMACGTGKTFTSLKIAEKLAGKGKRVLFLVPSLSLLSQTLTEWTQESQTSLHNFAVCSDSDVGNKKRRSEDDEIATRQHEIPFPATTDSRILARNMATLHDDEHMTVVFSTYHSIDVISKAQRENGLEDFDLVICDEAHRTTGATHVGKEDESAFVRIHSNDNIAARKRLYMTATPRIYGVDTKGRADDEGILLYSMDDESIYGKELFVINFSEAVQRGLLVDYKVIVLAVQEEHVSANLANLLRDEDNQLTVSDASKIVGCWKALSKIGLDEPQDYADHMKRAVAFCQVIEAQQNSRTHKVSSKHIAEMFEAVVENYQNATDIEAEYRVACEAEHIDGGMNASQKESKLSWLKEESPDNTCRVLSNVRCLSEGVDVPSLDAVLFLTPRNSQVDVVQSVGRVMRTAPGKQRGYVVLPVVIPTGMEPHEALNDNETYRVVWEVLQALRSHDDRFDAAINTLDLEGPQHSKMEVVAIADNIAAPSASVDKKKQNAAKAKSSSSIGSQDNNDMGDQGELDLTVSDIERAIYAKIVKKCGNRLHWEEWANDIATIANRHIDRITKVLADPGNTVVRQSFNNFAAEIRDDTNGEVTDAEIIEMLAQHMITKPVFETLFSDAHFASHNPMSKAMQSVLDILDQEHLEKETKQLEGFYNSVRIRAEGVDSAQGKQKIVVELYDKFFRNAFPRMTERLGIVYTPVEVVDFIIHSVNDVLKNQFGQTLGSDGVHIIDPFTGTGTFISRLLESGLITPEQLAYKYKNEIHANEIVLLAYYIAAVNIESTYHALSGGNEYLPFEGICLTDTFQMYESEDMISKLLVENSERRKRQIELDIRVIMANPPYSAKQESANDNNANISYPQLDASIRDTYAEKSSSTNKNSLYDSYIRAIRWASDRLGKDGGVIGYVTNGGWLDGNAMDGMRKCLAEEFSSLYIFHLRGNQRTSGETSRREGGKIFGGGSRSPIAITLFVKNPQSDEQGKIYFHDIGDYLSREEKLDIVSDFGSIDGIGRSNGWRVIESNEYGDWLNQRDDSFNDFILMGDKKNKQEVQLFGNYSAGVKTQRDAWCYNQSNRKLISNIEKMIDFYNLEVDRYASQRSLGINVRDFINYDPHKISWDVDQIKGVEKGRPSTMEDGEIVKSAYRPFNNSYLFYSKFFNGRTYQMPQLFPTAEAGNLVLCVTGIGAGAEFSTMIADSVPNLHFMDTGQAFPFKLYEKADEADHDDLFANDNGPEGYIINDGITDEGLSHFQAFYPDQTISKEDIFYYIYGILHSPEYRERYQNNLSVQLPRIPRVNGFEAFKGFSDAGRALADIHLHYEDAAPYPITIDGPAALSNEHYRVDKQWRSPKVTDPETGKKVDDLTVVKYNKFITLKDIPEKAYEYVVNGKPALKWVMERQIVKTDKASGIVNDANDWAIETMGNPRYPLELFQKVITVSLETLRIIESLPALDIES